MIEGYRRPFLEIASWMVVTVDTTLASTDSQIFAVAAAYAVVGLGWYLMASGRIPDDFDALSVDVEN